MKRTKCSHFFGPNFYLVTSGGYFSVPKLGEMSMSDDAMCDMTAGNIYTSSPYQEELFLCPLFFNLTEPDVFCAKKRGEHASIRPRIRMSQYKIRIIRICII